MNFAKPLAKTWLLVTAFSLAEALLSKCYPNSDELNLPPNYWVPVLPAPPARYCFLIAPLSDLSFSFSLRRSSVFLYNLSALS